MSNGYFITVKDIMQTSHFKSAKLLAGASGLNRPVKWVHILEGREFVAESVNGEELVLTTGIGFTGKEVALRFLEQLIQKNVSGLGIELVSYLKQVPEEWIKIADDCHFPLIGFTEFTRYVDITRNIHSMIIKKTKEQCNLEEHIWVSRWLKGELEEDEIKGHIVKVCPQSVFGYAVCLVEAGSSEKLRENALGIAMDIRPIFENNGFCLLNSIDDGQIVFVLLDKGLGLTWIKRVQRVVDQMRNCTDLVSLQENNFLGIGKIVNDVKRINYSLKTARDAVSIQKRLSIMEPVYENLHIFRVISCMEESSLKEIIHDYLQELIDYDLHNQGELVKTLKTFYQCRCSKQQTSEKLFIARQTLYFRLQKIKDLLGEDYLQYEKRMAVEYAIAAYEFLNGRHNHANQKALKD